VWKIKQNEKEKFKKDKIFTNPKFFKSEEGERKKKNKTLQNTLRESFFLAEEERHAHT